MIKGKKAGMTDVFLFMIIAIAVVFISAMFIYMGNLASTKLHEKLDGQMYGEQNMTEVVADTIGKVNNAYSSLYWISVMLIIGMVISIFIGSYLVTTRPIFFVPYAFVTIIAIIVSVGISNAYEDVIDDPTLASTFANFVGANFIMLQLPIWITVIGIVGGIIMFVRMGSREQYGGTIYG